MEEYSKDDLWIHDEQDKTKAYLLTQFFEDTQTEGHMPRPFGVIYAVDRPTYDEEMQRQVEATLEQKGEGDLDQLIQGGETWEIK
jgi:2-oxoglutarate ferredoxin oxidoreductase subunit beta